VLKSVDICGKPSLDTSSKEEKKPFVVDGACSKGKYSIEMVMVLMSIEDSRRIEGFCI